MHDHTGCDRRGAGRRATPLRPRFPPDTAGTKPKASTISVAQSLGICVPISIAARMIEVPSGTVTAWPSMVSAHVFFAVERGVPKVQRLPGQ